jgi:hypothetical protein
MMVDFRPRPRRTVWIVLLWSAAFLACRAAHGVPITDYITVQPIDVCSSSSASSCVPINSLPSGQNIWSNAAVGNVGFIEVTPTGDINVTRAIWNQIGIDVTFLPAVQDVSPSNTTVSVLSCAPAGTDCMSPQFQTLSQQPGISTGTAPTPPLSQNPTTINTFFVTHLSPPTTQPGILYGLAWVNNNGVAIAVNSLVGLGARPDTLAHELGHDLDLDHNTFGAGGGNNLLTAGNVRTLPSTTNPLSTLGAGMGTGTTDQLIPQQQNQVLLSGFMNPIPLVNTPATDPEGGNDFNVAFEDGGRPNEKLDTLTLTAPTSFQFDPSTVFSPLANPDGLTVNPSFSNCTFADDEETGCSSLVLDFTGGTPFVAGDSIDYSLCVEEDNTCAPISVDDLAGGTYTYNFETDVDGTPVEMYQTTSELTGPGDLASDSQDPDLLYPSEILDPTTFVGFSAEPCTIIAPATTCPALELEDGSPIGEDQPVPEPPAILILLVALAVLPVACRLSSRARPSFESGLA